MHTNTQIGFLETFIVFSFSVILGFERVSASINKPLESPRTSEILYFNSKYLKKCKNSIFRRNFLFNLQADKIVLKM